MGYTMNPETLGAFADELQKLASPVEGLQTLGRKFVETVKRPADMFKRVWHAPHTPGGQAARQLSHAPDSGGLSKMLGIDPTTREEFSRRLTHPIEGLREGWRQSTPMYELQKKTTELGQKMNRTFASPQEAAKAYKENLLKEIGEKDFSKDVGLFNKIRGRDPAQLKEQALSNVDKQVRKEFVGGAEHLLGSITDASPTQKFFESASRGGWTGAGKYTKYLPVGPKGLAVGFGAEIVPSVMGAQEASPTGEGGAAEEALRSLGSTAGMIAGTGVGLVPGTALWYLAQKGGSRLGRVIDRARAGADWRQALFAPSPGEATESLSDVQNYYG